MKNVDFFEQVKRLAVASFSFKKYKAMNRVEAVLICIILSPFMLVQLFLLLFLFSLSFFFSLLESPIKYLHSILREEGERVKHATQVVVYLVGWPIVFLSYAMVSFITIMIYVLYALASIFGYIWTLCAYKFHLYISEESIETAPIEAN